MCIKIYMYAKERRCNDDLHGVVKSNELLDSYGDISEGQREQTLET